MATYTCFGLVASRIDRTDWGAATNPVIKLTISDKIAH